MVDLSACNAQAEMILFKVRISPSETWINRALSLFIHLLGHLSRLILAQGRERMPP